MCHTHLGAIFKNGLRQQTIVKFMLFFDINVRGRSREEEGEGGRMHERKRDC